jgi:hypothetical protein
VIQEPEKVERIMCMTIGERIAGVVGVDTAIKDCDARKPR